MVFSFKARKRLDLGVRVRRLRRERSVDRLVQEGVRQEPAAVELAAGRPGASRPTGPSGTPTIAIVRRVWDFVPIVGDIPLPFIFHFDFNDRASGQPVLSVERKMSVRDRYRVTRPGPRALDFRVAAAMTVALDALQSR